MEGCITVDEHLAKMERENRKATARKAKKIGMALGVRSFGGLIRRTICFTPEELADGLQEAGILSPSEIKDKFIGMPEGACKKLFYRGNGRNWSSYLLFEKKPGIDLVSGETHPVYEVSAIREGNRWGPAAY